MNMKNEVYGKFQDDTGEEFYCPVNEVADNRVVSEWEVENCVEVSTAGRYSGNLTVIDLDAE
ncbi:MAG: hypothetical protein LJE65_16235 [Desulfobacteraceae bacterium]|nr:hypothetical protein [Desulfobacteraceae bacterium]